MSREHKAPAGPRPANFSPTRLGKTPSHRNRPPLPTANPGLAFDAPMLSATASNNHSLFSFGRDGETSQLNDPNASFDFLPSVSFDDLQSSIESASTEFKLTQFPSPTGEGSILEARGLDDSNMSSKPQAAPSPARPSNQSGTRPARSGSLLRRPSNSNRQPAHASNNISASGADHANGPTARARRQSQYPPVSSSVASKPPRKSIGPGIIGDSDFGPRTAQKRRPSLLSDGASTGSARASLDGNSSWLDSARGFPGSRAAKSKSVQPPPRPSHGNLSFGNTLTPEQNRHSTLTPRSPRVGGRLSTPSSSSKRVSMMPGAHHSSHATGLGARTISPTDTRRMKRLSIMPQSQSLNQVSNPPPPPPVSMNNQVENRAESKSPSMIPRKASATPSSSRTTPDLNRKSYSSGLSAASAFSFNTARTSTGSMHRMSGSSSTSRLPAPKHTTVHNPMPADDEEDVPPVPAIPKAYESPKDSPADTYFMEKKKTALSNLDAMSMNANSTGTISMPVFPEPTKVQRRPSARKSAYVPHVAAEGDNKATPPNKRHLQPLRLPPISLGPLSTPTANKIAALQDHSSVERGLSPPASRQLPKTPTTPMTASKSSFFSKSRHGDTPELPSLRSSSSVHQTHLTPTPPDASSTDSSLAFKEIDHKQSMSPFLSSSLPKGGPEHNFLKRSKTGADFTTLDDHLFQDRAPPKPAGPRAPKTEQFVPKSPPPEPVSEEPQTPSSMSSIRRKLSISWKRNNSKSNINAPADVIEKANGKHPEEAMPPPRIPISATLNNLSNMKQASPSPTIKQSSSGYLESRRRKSSGGSLNAFMSHDKTKSESWGTKKPVVDPSTMPVGRNTSVMQKILRPRTSSATVKGVDSWTAELDKDDLSAEEEMAKLGSRRKETEVAARTLDALRKRATPKERVGSHEAIRIAMLNIYERGEIVDYNDVYFCGTQNAHKVVGDLQSDAPNFGYDDERGDYTIVPGDHLAYRYEIIDVLGKGSFGQVVRCIDHKTGGLVAIKIIRNKKRFHQQALVEVNILQKLREWDPKNKHSMVNFTQSFYFRGHLCISTELLDMNLYELIKAHAFRGFSIRIIRRFTKQILSSLNLLKQHKVIHCDLKPENILLRHPLHSEIKVIDFGSSCFENEKVYTYIQSRFYRSPEVILGMTYGMPIDMWSVGCILAELYTGVPIFPGENEQEQLACIMEVFGPPEKHLIEKSTRKKLFFDSMGKPRLTVSSKGRRRRPSSKTLQQVLKCDDEVFLDFLARCLRWDPERRLRPEDAIRHEFITGRKMPVPRMPTRETSPMKRHNTISVPRPLPEPPGAGVKPAGSLRTGVSPHKPVSGGPRRASGTTGPISAVPTKRTSAGTAGFAQTSSGLPRAAGRSVSAKQDLAAAGATAAMSRRA
ncbi:serine/threonine protein kinase, CMGC, dual-specificity [Fusarium falciforme]|uniref:Serine/threonine protein kinase, CMGC, dual-specificity n=1 Tax=Fusarium falciforme TaxID=195108 RepID=A0A9W8V1U5_9HYPO|nr:serine/threonine protein kinase, CMGC, dual-specificity [Fusarium falciforme]KAJ4206554.1 serine/threonine protein kinase, CMGC, dual-specificity [Fusarium falciforme]KAJ4261106.1 serine/threonine protein kinase, CMGC, dual-specificity [Fusarium falciforme]